MEGAPKRGQVQSFASYEEAWSIAKNLSRLSQEFLMRTLAASLDLPQDPLPPIGSTVYIEGRGSEACAEFFPCVVRHHFPDGRIEVLEPGNDPAGTFHILRKWKIEPK